MPDGRDEIILADDVVAIFHQIDKQIKDLRLHRNQRGATAQLAPVNVERIVAEDELHGRSVSRMRSRSRGIIRAISRTNQASRKVFVRALWASSIHADRDH